MYMFFAQKVASFFNHNYLLMELEPGISFFKYDDDVKNIIKITLVDLSIVQKLIDLEI